MARAGRPFKADARTEELSSLIQKQDNQTVKEILLSLGVDVCDSDLRTALHWATFYNNLELLTWLIEQAANVNKQDKNGYTGLHFAAQQRQQVTAVLLLDNAADPNIADIHGNTALWTAVFNARDDWRLVRLYMQRGANPNIANKYQKTPANFAMSVANIDLATLL